MQPWQGDERTGPYYDSLRYPENGWVLVTLMTAGIVAVIWGVAQDQLQAILEGALDNVTPN